MTDNQGLMEVVAIGISVFIVFIVLVFIAILTAPKHRVYHIVKMNVECSNLIGSETIEGTTGQVIEEERYAKIRGNNNLVRLEEEFHLRRKDGYQTVIDLKDWNCRVIHTYIDRNNE